MICNNCGATFDPADISTYQEDYGELFHACPNCGSSDIEETESCELCGEELRCDELRSGFCLDCLWNAIDHETALAYMKDSDSLADFMLNSWFGSNVRVISTTDDLNQHFEKVFRGLAQTEELSKQFGISMVFLEACRYYCLPDYPEMFGVEGGEFAEWFSDYRKRGDSK